MAMRTRPTQFPELLSRVQTEHITTASRLVSHLTGFAIQPNKAVVGANAFAHESGIHQDGVIKNPLTYEIMTPQSVGLSGSQLTIGKLSGRKGLQKKLHDLGHDVSGDALDIVYREAIALADVKKEVTDADLLALVQQRAGDLPASIVLDGWSVTSSHGGKSTGSVRLALDGEERAGESTGNGPVNALYRAVDEAIRPVVGWEPTLSSTRSRPSPRADAQGRVFLRCRRSTDAGDDAIVVTGHGFPRTSSRRRWRRTCGRQQALGSGARRGGAARAPAVGAPAMTAEAAFPATGWSASRVTASGRTSSRREARPGRGRRALRIRHRLAGDRGRRGGIDAYGMPIRPRTWPPARRATRSSSVPSAPEMGRPAAPVRPEQALFAMRGGLGLFATSPGERPPGARGGFAPSAGAARRRGHADRARADRRPLLRRAGRAGGGDRRARRARLLPYSEPEVARSSASPRARAGAPEAAHQRGQGERAGHLAPVADRGPRDRGEYPDVALDDRLVDACAMQIVRSPASFDVLVTENLFGDILSDEASVLAGSLGMLPRRRSARAGPRTASTACTSRSTAPRRTSPAGPGQPDRTVLSAAMLLRWSLGSRTPRRRWSAR